MNFKTLFIAFSLLLISACETVPLPVAILNTEVNIFDGKGITGITLDKSTKSDVTALFGKDFIIEHKEPFYTQMVYKKLGLVFRMRYKDPYESIFRINVEAPFSGQTETNIVLGVSTMQDVVNVYGDSRWITIKEVDTWWKMYKGIEFHVEAATFMPRFPLRREHHLSQKIVKISIDKSYFKIKPLKID